MTSLQYPCLLALGLVVLPVLTASAQPLGAYGADRPVLSGETTLGSGYLRRRQVAQPGATPARLPGPVVGIRAVGNEPAFAAFPAVPAYRAPPPHSVVTSIPAATPGLRPRLFRTAAVPAAATFMTASTAASLAPAAAAPVTPFYAPPAPYSPPAAPPVAVPLAPVATLAATPPPEAIPSPPAPPAVPDAAVIVDGSPGAAPQPAAIASPLVTDRPGVASAAEVVVSGSPGAPPQPVEPPSPGRTLSSGERPETRLPEPAAVEPAAAPVAVPVAIAEIAPAASDMPEPALTPPPARSNDIPRENPPPPGTASVRVKYFTPVKTDDPIPPGTLVAGSLPAANPAAPVETMAPLPAPEEKLSPETMAILSSLPKSALQTPDPMSRSVSGKVSIKRNVEKPDAVPKAKVSRSTERGMSIEVRPVPVDVNMQEEQAYNALLAGNTEGAVAIYRQVLDAHPNDKNALFGLATTYHRLGQLDDARPLYGRLLKIDPDNVEALNNFLALVGAEAPHAAIEQLQELAAENPDFAPIPAQISLLYQKLGDYPQSVHYMSQASAISPENLAYRYNLAVLCDKGGFTDKAIGYYRSLLMAYQQGQALPASAKGIQERLTYLSSN